MVIFLLLGLPASAASAQAFGQVLSASLRGRGRRRPPSRPLPAGPGCGARALDADRSAAPLVLAGLLAVMGSLTVVGLRRRSHIVRRDLPPRAPTPARPVPQSVAPTPALSEQAALRSSVR